MSTMLNVTVQEEASRNVTQIDPWTHHFGRNPVLVLVPLLFAAVLTLFFLIRRGFLRFYDGWRGKGSSFDHVRFQNERAIGLKNVLIIDTDDLQFVHL